VSDGATPIEKASLQLPITLRLTRRGDTLTAEYSTDEGKSFQAVDRYLFVPPLPKTLHVGLLITADNRTRVSEARFSVPQIRKL
jgi:regulation of enolase protein 1 (concanavalin A-like superfamily)